MKFSPAYYWPKWLANSLPQKEINWLKVKKYQRTQEYLWQALNIYDDFIDGAGQAIDLPQANIYYRKFLKTFYLANLSASFQEMGDKIINNLDSANQKEIKCNQIIWKNGAPNLSKNIPDSSRLVNLSKKSLALAILPIAAVITNNKTDNRRLINFFRYALAAKQLSDDAKDWLTDLRAGKLTAVNILVIKDGLKQKINKTLYRKPAVLHLLFAQSAAIPTCHNILKLCSQARKEAHKLKIKDQAPILKNLIQPLERAAKKALQFERLLS